MEDCTWIDSTEKWIETRSGVRGRRFAGAHETLLDMAVTAGAKGSVETAIQAEQVASAVLASMSDVVQTPPAGMAADGPGALAAFLPLAMEQLLSVGAGGSGEVNYAGQVVLPP